MRILLNNSDWRRPDLIRGFAPAPAFSLCSCIFRQLLSLGQSWAHPSSKHRGRARGPRNAFLPAEQKLLGNQTSNKFIFKARDLGNWNYLGGIPFNGNCRISSFLAENIPGCDEALTCAQGSAVIRFPMAPQWKKCWAELLFKHIKEKKTQNQFS